MSFSAFGEGNPAEVKKTYICIIIPKPWQKIKCYFSLQDGRGKGEMG